VTNVTIRFETSINTNPNRKMWGYMAYYVPPSKKVGGHVPRVLHQIAPMSTVNFVSTNYVLSLTILITSKLSFSRLLLP